MRPSGWVTRAALLAAVWSMSSAPRSEAQSGGSFSFQRLEVGASGHAAAGGNFSLQGDVGEMGATTSSGSSFVLTGGFFSGARGLVSVDPGPIADRGPGIELYAPQPSPSSAGTSVQFRLPQPGRVTLAVYGVNGAMIRLLAAGDYPEGVHAVAWDRADGSGRRAPPGIYWVHVSSGGVERTRKLVLL